MYDENFSNIYFKYGWDKFSINLGNSIIEFMLDNDKHIKTHLDLACGVGTLCSILDKENILTRGVDISESMLEYARENYPHIEFIKSDITKFVPKEKYDLITCACDSLNHIKTFEEVKSILKNVYNSLNDGGYFICDILDDENLTLNEDIISKRSEDVYVKYFITKENDDFVNTNIKTYECDKCIDETNIKEKIYIVDSLINYAESLGFTLIKKGPKILESDKPLKDKVYIILKK